MIAFRLMLMMLLAILVGYTLPELARDGINFFPPYIADVTAMRWPGQFHIDFSTFLVLSAFWTAWRAHFSPGGLALGFVALFMGGVFLLPYLLYLSARHGNDAAAILLGDRREGTS